MKLSKIELQLPLGDSLAKSVEEMARKINLTPEKWIQVFLIKGRLTPEIEGELVDEI